MNNRFRTEGWRIAKYILISLACNIGFALLWQPLVNNVILSANQPGRLLPLFSYGQILLSTVVSCLLHRYFTFRASEKWYIALLMMLAFAFAMQCLTSFVMSIAARFGTEAVITASYAAGSVEAFLAYLFQRYVIYCHSTDQGGWYRRFHPTNEEGEIPHE